MNARVLAAPGGKVDPSDLGRHEYVGSVHRKQERAQPVLRQPVPVPGCGIEVADAAVPCRTERALGDLLGRLEEYVAQRCPPESKTTGRSGGGRSNRMMEWSDMMPC